MRSVLRHAKLVSALGILLTIGLLVVVMQLRPDNRLSEATPQDHEAIRALEHVQEAFGGALSLSVLCEWTTAGQEPLDELALVLSEVHAILERSPFTRGPLSALELAAVLPASVGSSAWDRLALLPDELVQRFLRRDLGRAVVTARIPDAGTREAEPAYAALEQELEAVRARHPGFAVHLSGTSYIARRNINVIIADFAKGLGVAALVIFVVMTIAFRSLRLGAVAVLPNAFPLVVAAAALVVFNLELQVVSALAFSVCLGIAVDDTIHFVVRFRRELEAHGNLNDAIVAAFIGVGRALLVTTFVLLGGFGVMLFSEIPTTVLFAQICTIGLMAALVGDLLFLPALLAVFLRGGSRSAR